MFDKTSLLRARYLMPSSNLETLLSSSPSNSRWGELLRLTEGFSEDRIEVLAPDVEAWAGDMLEQTAPPSWIERRAGGEYLPADALITSLDLSETALSGAKVVKILKNPHMTRLRELDVGRLKVSNTFWKAVRGADATRHLRELRCGYIIDRNSSQFDGQHHLEQLETLTIRQSKVVKDAHLMKLLAAPMTSSVAHLIVELEEPDLVNWFLSAMSGEDTLPSLSELTVVTPVGAPLKNIFDAPIAQRVESISVQLNALYSDLYEQLRKSTEGGTSGPEHLDLSGVTIDPGHLDDFDDEAAARYMNNALRRWQLPSQTQKISLGGWWNENLEGILTERGLEVVR